MNLMQIRVVVAQALAQLADVLQEPSLVGIRFFVIGQSAPGEFEVTGGTIQGDPEASPVIDKLVREIVRRGGGS